jgi:cytochrome P450
MPTPLPPAHFTDPLEAFDRAREAAPAGAEPGIGLAVHRHAEARRILRDPATFSSAVSSRRSIPSSLDGEEHRQYRQILEPFFAPERIRPCAARCRALARKLIPEAPAGAAVTLEWMEAVAHPYAAQVLCDFLGWPDSAVPALLAWQHRQAEAERAQDRAALAALAEAFDAQVAAGLRHCAPDSPSAELTRVRREGRPLPPEEIASILRNWSAGEVGTLATAAGILVHFLARHPERRDDFLGPASLADAAQDEVLRLHGPLPTNRRRTTCPVAFGPTRLDADARLTLFWPSIQRDPRAFADPLDYRPGRTDGPNLLYGEGVHACPGAPLARLQLGELLRELLTRFDAVALVPERPPVPEAFPAVGFARLPLRLLPRETAP